MSTAAPGWYPDPSVPSQLRWWDGTAWTVTAPTAQPAPPRYAPAPLAAPFPLATFGARAGARILDSLLLAAVTLPILLLALIPFFASMGAAASDISVSGVPLGSDQLSGDQLSGGQVVHVQSSAAMGGLFASFFLFVLVLMALAVLQVVYEVVLTARWGMTVGKRVVGIRVRSISEDRHPTWLESLIRAAVIAIGGALGSGIFTLLDYLWPLWDKPWEQTLHDKAAKTVVVPR